MKNTLLSILAVAAMVSCSNEKTQSDDSISREIKLNGVVTGVSTKNSIGATDNFTAAIGGWESTNNPVYTTTPTWQTTASISGGAQNNDVTFALPQYYNADNGIKTYVKGWYPAGTPASGIVSFANTDGSVDVLYANAVSGSKLTPIASSLTFNHLTSQLNFEVVAGKGLAAGTTLTSITVKNVQAPVSLNLANGSLGAEPAKDYLVQNITTNPTIKTALPVGNPLMILSGTTLKVKVVTSNATFDDVVVTLNQDASLVAGKAYTIKLTFTQVGIVFSSSVTPWSNETGAGQVE